MNTEKLKASAERQKSILAYIASFDPTDIDGDTVDLRFEDENGCDTGCDVSIVAECQRSADLVGELIAALEAAGARIAELEARTVSVKLPEPATEGGRGYRQKVIWALQGAFFDAGINLETGGE
ncbi:hypothetical protein ACT5AM_004085 [Cronobacter malonaticus]